MDRSWLTFLRTSIILPPAAVLFVSACLAPVPQPLASSAAPALALVDVAVVDVERGEVVPHRTVVVVGRRVSAIGGVGQVRIPRGSRVVNARGKYLMPGLWDMHVHVWDYPDIFFPLLLANGVTGIRQAGGPVPLATAIEWRREVTMGTRVGPPRQLVTGGLLEGADNQLRCPVCGGHAPVIAVPTPEVARRVVDSLKAAGADFIKTHELGRSAYFAVAAEARRIGIPFGGHADGSASEVSDSGAQILDHVNAAGLTPACFTDEAGGSGSRGASVAQCEPIAARLRRNGTWFVPTLLILTPPGKGRAAQVTRRYYGRLIHDLGSYWPDSVREHSVMNWYNRTVLWYRDSGAAVAPLDTTRPGTLAVMQQAGMPLLAGTDASPLFAVLVPGFSLHAELGVMVAEGVPPLDALRAATLNPAKALHATDSLGTVAVGKLADLVLLDGNPLVDIANTETVRAVVADGRYFDRAALDSVLATVARGSKHVSPGER